MKALFIIGQCIRLFHTDPWNEYTYHIEQIGRNSYLVSVAMENTVEWTIRSDSSSIYFDEQKQYEAVNCPPIPSWIK